VTMYRVLLERTAEKDLSRLSSEIHDRVLAAIQALRRTRARPVAANWPAANTTGASAWATTAWFTKLLTRFASCASAACAIAAKFIAEIVFNLKPATANGSLGSQFNISAGTIGDAVDHSSFPFSHVKPRPLAASATHWRSMKKRCESGTNSEIQKSSIWKSPSQKIL
jgi:hypothetical protein